MLVTATVTRLRDDEAVASGGPTFAATFADAKARVSPPLDQLVDACISTLSHPSPTAAAPSPIQAECWAVMLGDEPADIVGVSATGSGKTLAFLLPAFASLMQALPTAAATPSAQLPADPATVKVQAEAAMRDTAVTAFAEAVKSGLGKDDAKEVARKKAKAAYRAVMKASSAPGVGTAAAKPAVAQGALPSATPTATATATVPLAPGAAQPRAIVLAPTRELCLQISAVCDAISNHLVARLGPEVRATIACGCIVGGIDFNRQRQALLGQQPRLLVATPGRLLSQAMAHLPLASR